MCFAKSSSHLVSRRGPDCSGPDSVVDLTKTIDIWGTVDFDGSATIKAIELEPNVDGATSLAVELGQQRTVGRARSANHCVLPDRLVSRQHFSVTCESSHGVLRDLASTNGTMVNGVSVKKATLYDGDLVTAGSTTFTVRFLRD